MAELEYQSAEVANRLDRVESAVIAAGEAVVSAVAASTVVLSDAIGDAAAEVVYAIQKMSSYLGAQLCEVRWSIERQTEVSQEILQVLMNSLENESRQYFEQGVDCFDNREFALANKALEKALEANLTNHFAYQYLGFVAVEQDRPDAAIRNFELARKFARTDRHAAFALSHLARANFAVGRHAEAATASQGAFELIPEEATYHWEHALYCCAAGRTTDSLSSLRSAIQRDWTYFALAAIERSLRPVSSKVAELLDALRQEERSKAQLAAGRLDRVINLYEQHVGELPQVKVATCERAKRLAAQENVYSYREAQELSRATVQDLASAVINYLDIAVDRGTIQHRNDVSAFENNYANLQSKIAVLESAFEKGKYGFHCGFIVAGLTILLTALYSLISEQSLIMPPIIFAVAVLWWLVPWSLNNLTWALDLVPRRSELQKQYADLEVELRNAKEQSGIRLSRRKETLQETAAELDSLTQRETHVATPPNPAAPSTLAGPDHAP